MLPLAFSYSIGKIGGLIKLLLSVYTLAKRILYKSEINKNERAT